MNRYIFTTWLLVAGILCCDTAQACPDRNCVRVGSWNIEWFGSEKRSQPMDRKTIHAMAKLIAEEWSIDILSLEEINTEFDGTLHGEQYHVEPWQQLRDELAKYGYRTFAGDSGYAQHIVLAWRAPVSVLENPDELPVPTSYTIDNFCRSSNLRKPLAGYFQAGHFDFWVVGVHLKSSAGQQSRCTAAIRSAEASVLTKALKPMANRDPDIILTGDMNAGGRNSSLDKLLDSGFFALDDQKHRSHRSNTISHLGKTSSKQKDRGSLLDHIMVRSSTMGEWKAYSTTIYNPRDRRRFVETYSDHFPIWADFSTATDDD